MLGEEIKKGVSVLRAQGIKKEGVPGVKLLSHSVVVAERRHYVRSCVAGVVQW
jgi:hypothetical protein